MNIRFAYCSCARPDTLTVCMLQVATDALVSMERAMARDKIATNDRQLACARINSEEGQSYLKVWTAPA